MDIKCQNCIESIQNCPPTQNTVPFNLCCIFGTPASWDSSRCFSSFRERHDPLSCRSSSFQPPSPSNCSNLLWCFLSSKNNNNLFGTNPEWNGTHHRDGLCVMLSKVMPRSLAVWNIVPSTSILTALVHSSRRANFGLQKNQASK